jgi:hypothetical protein
MSSLNHIAAARDDTFAGRVTMISLKVAQNVAAEDPGAADHEVRVQYAQRIFRGADQTKLLSAHVIASNPTIQAKIDEEPTQYGANVGDDEIEFALSSIWTARAMAFVDVPATQVGGV